MELLRKVFAFGKWALVGGGLYQVLKPEGLPASLVLLSEIVIVAGIPCFFIFGTWLLCLNWVELRDRGLAQSVKDEWFDIKARTGIKTWYLIVSSAFFWGLIFIPAYINDYVVGEDSVDVPLWEQVFTFIGAIGILICMIAFFVSRNKTDKD